MITQPVRAAAVAALLAAALTACSGGAAPTATAPTTAPATTTAATTTAATADPAADRAAVEKTFADYNSALLARDFTTACSLTAPQATEALVTAITAQGAQVTTCEEAFGAVYAVAAASGPLDDAARTSTIGDVTISGDTATVTYSGEAAGQRREGLTNKMQRIDGTWKLLGNDA